MKPQEAGQTENRKLMCILTLSDRWNYRRRTGHDKQERHFLGSVFSLAGKEKI